MGKRILDMISGAAVAVVGLIIGIAIWGRRSPQMHTKRNENHSSSASCGHPPAQQTGPVILPIQPPMQQHSGSGPQHTETAKKNQNFSLRHAITNWSFWMALGTLVLAYFSVRGFYLASDSAHKQLRAYLFLSSDVHIDVDGTGLITFRTTGQN